LQQIAILLISAISIIFYNNKEIKKCSFILVSGAAFVLALGNIIIGFHLYSNLMDTILKFAKKDVVPDLSGISNWVYVQFSLDALIVCFIVAAVWILKEYREDKNENN
jgi:hypothetical protein